MDNQLQGDDLLGALKARAGELQAQLSLSGQVLNRGAALEAAAREEGFRDWNAASAAARLTQTTVVPSRLLSSSASERPPAPKDVWDLNRHSTWHLDIWRLMSDFIGPDVKKAFRSNPPEYLVSDDLTWLDDLVLEVRGIHVDSKAELAERLLDRYRAIRACHGTSAPTVDSFYKQGLRPLDIQEFHDQARKIFLSGEYSELSEDNLERAMEYVSPVTREGRVYFEANERFLIEMCGHYMLYGSEYLTALAANLGGTRDYRRVLKNRFDPTLFVCDVPLENLHPGTVAEFAGTALESIFQELLDGPTYAPDKWRGAGFSIRVPLEPSCIVGHWHPTIKRDPLR
ncbi:glyoxalase superfamily protein [Delftia sp. ZNC0008]|uniref:glyoxalase superfamily protein n=1 Tax=Delftia sp. ZNC0008 TaxID=1339242 RepID=UPI0006462DE4|nr:glyoxalase superfamily protein [Delftia sp. ZNC0008]